MTKIKPIRLAVAGVLFMLSLSTRLYAATDTTVKGTTSNNAQASLEVTNSSNTSLMFVRNDGNVGVGTAAPDAVLHLKAGTASAGTAPLKFTSGTSLTTAEDGAIEMDDNVFYGATDAGNRGHLAPIHLLRQDSAYTLANSGSAQNLFNAVTNGQITLEAGTYKFEALVAITSMSATSGNATFRLAGTATLGSILWYGYGRDAAADAATGTLAGSFSTDATLVTAPLVTAATNTAMFAHLKGTFEVTGAGTLIPQVTLQTAVGTAAVAAGSYFEVYRVGSTTLTAIGQWD